MGEHLVAVVAVLDLDVTAVGRASEVGCGRCLGCTKRCRQTGGPRGGSTQIIPSRTVGPAPMVCCFAMGVVMGILATVNAVEAVGAGDTRRAGEVVKVLGVAGVEETGKAEVLVGAVEEVKAVGARSAGEAIEVRDAVEAGDIARAGKVV